MRHHEKLGALSVFFICSLSLITIIILSVSPPPPSITSVSAYLRSQLSYKTTGGISKHKQRGPGQLTRTRWRLHLSRHESPPTQEGGLCHVTLPCLAPPPAAVPDGSRAANEGVGHFVSVSCGTRWWPLGRESERYLPRFSCLFFPPLYFVGRARLWVARRRSS